MHPAYPGRLSAAAIVAACALALATVATTAPPAAAAPAPRGGIGDAYRQTVPAAVRIVLPLRGSCLRGRVLEVRVLVARGVRLLGVSGTVAGRHVRLAPRAGRMRLRVPRRGRFAVTVTAKATSRDGHASRTAASATYRSCAR